ncbi:MAG TPA: hypothetical protein VLA44_02425 [Clostridia bacterium]|nr:hypothetical protein [Clostridia bacterium]
MHNATTPRAPQRPLPRPHSSAFTWIDQRHALVARTMPSGAIDVTEVDLPGLHEDEARALTRVADVIGDRERVVVTGPRSMRTALERQYVAIFHRPDRLIDIEPDGPLTRRQLVERLEELTR